MIRTRGESRVDTAALKRERPLEDVVAAYGISLRRGGAGRYWALCPFHQERTASFCVDARDPDDPHFHCFSCSEHGDVIDLVMRLEDCSFSEACDRLTHRRRPQPVGEGVRRERPTNSGRRWDLIAPDSAEARVLALAADVFAAGLNASTRAQRYLHERGVSLDVARAQRVGYANGLSLLPALRGVVSEDASPGSIEVATELGLLVKRPDGEHSKVREFFFDRLIIPEVRGGQPIWFIGRAIEDAAAPSAGSSEVPGRRPRPKYLSLPGERPILGLERVLGRSTAYLVEGPLDWLAGVAWGLPVFAICGTHVPVERLPSLGAAVAIYGVFDPDRAGHSAAERFAPLMGARWRPITLPNGMDLAELAERGEPGRELFQGLVARARARAWRQGRT
jgi:DNA primase catalytic core